MNYQVIFDEAATAELEDLYDFISVRASPQVAEKFVTGLTDYCAGLATFPKRGTERPDLMAGIRVIGYRRAVSIVFSVEADTVLILGVFSAGRNITIDLLEGRT